MATMMSQGALPGSGGKPSRPQETPEQRKARKEKEARKQKEHDAAKRRREHDKAKTAKDKDKAKAAGKAKEVTPANRLARQTAFQCTIQFRNDLPPVPVEPKLLPVPTSWARFVSYDACLSLDAERQHDLLLEPELSIPLDVLEAPQYQVQPTTSRPPLDAEDEALLRSEGGGKMGKGQVTRTFANKVQGDFTWLLRTQYISEDQVPKHLGVSEKKVKEMRNAETADAPLSYEDAAAAQLAAIEASFEAATRPPVHATKPHLTPVEILPVFPDEERWLSPLVQVVFDVDPTENLDHCAAPPDAATRRQLASKALIKSFSTSTKHKFAAYLVPSEAGLRQLQQQQADADQATTSGAEAEAVDYAWVREYHYQPTDHQLTDQMVFFFTEGLVTYVPFESKLVMQKQKSRGMQDATNLAQQEVPRPSAIKVKKRKYTEEEEAARLAHLHAFRHPYDEETMEYDDGGGGGGGGSGAPTDGAGTAAAADGFNAEG